MPVEVLEKLYSALKRFSKIFFSSPNSKYSFNSEISLHFQTSASRSPKHKKTLGLEVGCPQGCLVGKTDALLTPGGNLFRFIHPPSDL